MKVAVIGAGIVGTSIAYHLSRLPSAEVVVVDRSRAGSGASGHSFAWTNAFSKRPRHYHDLNRRSMDLWPRFVNELAVPGAYSYGGNLVLENTVERAEALKAQVAELQSWGYPCRLLNSEELAALEPELGRHQFTAACYLPREGHVDVQAVIEAGLEAIRRNGGQVFEDTGPAIVRVAPNGHIEAVETPAMRVECDVVVAAGGTDTPEIVAAAGVTIPQEVSPGIVIRTDARPRLLHSLSLVHLPAISPDRPEMHLRQLPEGTLHMGQGTQESLDRDDSQAHADDLLSRAAHYFPALLGATAIAQPVGYRPLPADGLPAIGFTRAAPNLYVAMMHSGVTLAPLVGELAAVEIVDGVEVDFLAPYRAERFS